MIKLKDLILEKIVLDVKVGDVILAGRFKNKKVVVKLLIKDVGAEASNAIEVARYLAYKENVHAIIGPNSSRAAIPASIIANNSKVPMVTNGATHGDITKNKPYIFRVTLTNEQQTQRLVDYTFNELKIRKVAILFDIANVYSRDIAELFKADFETKGGEVLLQNYVTGTMVFSACKVTR